MLATIKWKKLAEETPQAEGLKEYLVCFASGRVDVLNFNSNKKKDKGWFSFSGVYSFGLNPPIYWAELPQTPFDLK